MKVIAIAQHTFREAVRNKILYSVLFFAALIVAISALFGAVTIGNQVKVIKDFGLFSLSFFGAIMAMISGVTLLNKEIKQKTIYNILSKPVYRWEFIVGKHLGLSLTIGVLVSLMGCCLVVFTALFEGRIDWLLFEGILFCVFEVVVVSSVVIFFSSLVVTTTLTGLFTLGTYIAGRSISYLRYFTERGEGYNPVLSALVKVFDWILPDLSLFNISDSIVYGNAVSGRVALLAFLYCVSYSAVMLVLSSLIFSKRELV